MIANRLMGNEKESVDTICDVIRSYLSHLREPFCSVLVPAIGDDVVFGYMRGLLERYCEVSIYNFLPNHQ